MSLVSSYEWVFLQNKKKHCGINLDLNDSKIIMFLEKLFHL